VTIDGVWIGSNTMTRNSSVNIVTGLRDGLPGYLGLILGRTDFYILESVQTGSGAHSGFCVIRTEFSFTVVKRPGREAGRSLPSSALSCSPSSSRLHVSFYKLRFSIIIITVLINDMLFSFSLSLVGCKGLFSSLGRNYEYLPPPPRISM
jgi:hypothetical protein